MDKKELEKMSKDELAELAGRHKLPVTPKTKKSELVEALCAVTLEDEPHEKPPEPPAAEPEAGMQQAVEESKYYTGPPVAEPYGLPTELPHSYNEDRVALLVRDPQWLFSFWEVTTRKLEAERAALGHNAHLTLRLYDVTDIIFNGHNAHSYHDIGIYDRVGNWYINTGRPDRSFVLDLGLKTPDGRFVTLARSNAVRTPRETISEVLDEEWVSAQEEFERIFALSGGYAGAGGVSSAEIMAAGAQRVPFGIASPGISSLALMSPAMIRRERGFWFVLNAELIIYGATEPDATVTVQGQRVELRPDGTFTLRFALPDGKQVIPCTATSADGEETRTIKPEVTRKTGESTRKTEAA